MLNMARERAVKIYMTAIIGSGFIVLVLFTVLFPIKNIFSAIFFVVLACVAEAQTVSIGDDKFISVSSAVVSATMLTSGPAAAVLIAVACVLGSVTKVEGKTKTIFNTKLEITLFNMSNYAIAFAVMCLVYFGFGGETVGHYDTLDGIFRQLSNCSVQLILSVVLSVVCNLLIVATYVSIKNNIAFFRVLAPNIAWPFISVVIIGILGVFLTALYVVYGWYMVVLFFLPFMLARYTFTTYKNLQQNYLQTVESLATAIEAKDEYTSGHSRRVELYCAMIAKEMKLPAKRCETLKYAALLHDVGKIGIPEKILNKPGRLDDEEWAYIRSHPEKGAHIIADIEFLKDAVEIVRSHHERYAGGGYPDGKSAKDLPVEAMIICVADSYDAMTSDRPYRNKLSNETAMNELHSKSGVQFMPQAVAALERALIRNGELSERIAVTDSNLRRP
jgi:putative nucleotidyltransferase with HDIG domain